MKKYGTFSNIDFVKFFMAIFVIAIHTNLIENCNNVAINRLFYSTVSLAVPFFFMSSGFLLGNKIIQGTDGSTANLQVLRKHILKIVKLYVIWSIVYMPLAIYYFIHNNIPLMSAFYSYFRGFFLIGENYNSWILWYLLSTIYALIGIYILLKKNINIKTIFLIGIFMSFFGFLLDYISTINSNSNLLNTISKIIKCTIRDGRLTNGFLYIYFGFFASKFKISFKTSLCIFLICFVLSLFFDDGIIFKILRIFYATSFFVLVLNWNLKLSLNYLLLRTLSTVMYFIHLYIWTGYYFIIYGHKNGGLDSFIVVTLISVLVGIIYYYVKPNLKKITWLFNK